MLLSLVDSLRCPAHAEESPLVLSVEAWEGQRVSEGVLGCPACHARYAIHRGGVVFGSPVSAVRPETPTADALRLAAQLDLAEPGGTLLLTGRYAAAHGGLTDLVDVTCLLIDAEESSSPRAVNVDVEDRLPLIDGALRGAAVDAPRNLGAFLDDVIRCVRPGGRLVMPNALDNAYGLVTIAQDVDEWVGERPAQPVVQLRIGRRDG